MNKEELKKEWVDHYKFTPNDKLLGLDAIADWWFSKLDAYESSLLERIEGMKIKHPIGSLADEHMTDKEKYHNEVIDDIIELIKKEKE